MRFLGFQMLLKVVKTFRPSFRLHHSGGLVYIHSGNVDFESELRAKKEGKERGEEERETSGSVAWWIVDSGTGLSQALATQCSDGNSAGNCRNLSALRRVGLVGMVRRNHRSVRENRKCNWRSGFKSSQERRKSL